MSIKLVGYSVIRGAVTRHSGMSFGHIEIGVFCTGVRWESDERVRPVVWYKYQTDDGENSKNRWYGQSLQLSGDVEHSVEGLCAAATIAKKVGNFDRCGGNAPKELVGRLMDLKAKRMVYDGRASAYVAVSDVRPAPWSKWVACVSHSKDPNYGGSFGIGSYWAESEERARDVLTAVLAGKEGSIQSLKTFLEEDRPVRVCYGSSDAPVIEPLDVVLLPHFADPKPAETAEVAA